MAEYVAVTLAREIEVRVVSQIDHGFLVGGGGVFDLQRVCIRPGIRDGDFQISGKAFFAVFAEVGKLKQLAVFLGKSFGCPYRFVEALDAAVQAVLAVVFRKRVGLAVQHKLRMADAVSVAANQRAEITFVIHVPVDSIVTEDHVGELAAAVRNLERDDCPAIVRDGDFRSVLIREHKKIGRLAIRSFPKGFFSCRTRLRFCASRRQSGHKQRSRKNCNRHQTLHSSPPYASLSGCSTESRQ